MSRYERMKVEVRSLGEGDTFEHPARRDTVCRVSHTSLKEDDAGHELRIIGYDILEGGLHWPVTYLPSDYPVILLLPTTTYVQLSGKGFIESLTEQHGVKP
jgi:hypothetical protein